MKTIFYFLLMVAAVLAAIPLIPLDAAVNLLQLRRIGFEAEHIEGNVWEGQMYAVKLGPIDLGDVHSKMSLDELTSGRVRLDLTGSEDSVARLRGGFSFGWGGLGIDRFSLAMPVMAGPPPIGGITLILDGLTARFPDGECADGRGEVRAYLPGALPQIGLPNEMGGPALCRDGQLAFDMESPSGRETQEITILSLTKYKMRTFLKPTNPQVIAALQSKGFRPFLDGYMYAEERTLGGGAEVISGTDEGTESGSSGL